MPRTSIRQVSGLDRGAFSPCVAAAALWMEAAGQEIEQGSLERLLVKLFPDRIFLGYLSRFQGFQPSLKDAHLGQASEPTPLADDAVLEAGASLRKILICIREDEIFNEDEDFDADPTYARSAEQLEQLRTDVEGLGSTLLCKCPKCSLIGGLHSWFGMRTISRKRISQSWCRVCRSFHTRSVAKRAPSSSAP
jgi:hypothetical protein